MSSAAVEQLNFATFSHEQFLKSYLNQDFSLPDSISYYITQNPLSAKVYQKLIESCKQFFVKNPILVFHCLLLSYGEKKVCSGELNCTKITDSPITDLNFKASIWISNALAISYSRPNNITSFIISKIYKSNIFLLLLCNQEITFNEFLLISSKLTICRLYTTIVKDENGKDVSIEKLIENCPAIKWFTYFCHSDATTVLSKTSEEIFKVIKFPQTFVQIQNVPESFEIQKFFKNLKKTKAFIILEFAENCTENYQSQLETIIDEILQTDTFEYIPPLILFPELNSEKKKALKEICLKNWMQYNSDIGENECKYIRAI